MSNFSPALLTSFHRIQNLFRACLFWTKNLTSNFDPTENKLHNQEYVNIHTYPLYGDKKNHRTVHCGLMQTGSIIKHTLFELFGNSWLNSQRSPSQEKKDGRVTTGHRRHHFYKLRNIHENGYRDYNEAQGSIIVNSAHWTQWPKITAKKSKILFRFGPQSPTTF